MPLIHQQVINQNIQLGVWHITEPLTFFTQSILLQNNIVHPQKKLQHAAGRYILQVVQPNFPVFNIVVAANNKPYLANQLFQFSISHCGNYAAAIVSEKKQVGIDVEIPTTKVLKVLHKFLSEEEKLQFNLQQAGTNNILLATVLWSAKEALFKWWGKGEVDFKKHLYIYPFALQQYGSITALFKGNATHQTVQMQYKLFDDFVLVYTV